MKSLSPNIFVNNINETIDFYKILGFTTIMTVPEEGDFIWVMMKHEEVTIMFQTFESLANDLPEINRTKGGSLLFYIIVADVNSYFEKIYKKVSVLKGLEKTFYGATEFSILDNNGYVLTFAEQ